MIPPTPLASSQIHSAVGLLVNTLRVKTKTATDYQILNALDDRGSSYKEEAELAHAIHDGILGIETLVAKHLCHSNSDYDYKLYRIRSLLTSACGYTFYP